MRPLIRLNPVLIESFWSLVDKKGINDCWDWKDQIIRGYGRFRIDNYNHLAHVVAFVIEHKVDPIDLVIRHSCDNRKCVNVRHLLDGTQSDNIQDRVERSRTVSGNSLGGYSGIMHYRANITFDEVKRIHWLANFMTHLDISKLPEFKDRISRSQITKIINGQFRKDS